MRIEPGFMLFIPFLLLYYKKNSRIMSRGTPWTHDPERSV